MNEKIRQLAEQAGIGFTLWDDSGREMIDNYTPEECLEKFAELIVRECVKECQQEWYDLNNAPEVENESIRGAGIRVGQKNGVLKCISKIKKHFGVEE
jgi:hypothetical protein